MLRLLDRFGYHELALLAADTAEAALRMVSPGDSEYPRLTGCVRSLRSVILGESVDMPELVVRIVTAWTCSTGKTRTICNIIECAVRAVSYAGFNLPVARGHLVAALGLLGELDPEGTVGLLLWRMPREDQIDAALAAGRIAREVADRTSMEATVWSYVDSAWRLLEGYRTGEVYLGSIETGVVNRLNRLVDVADPSPGRALALIAIEIGKAMVSFAADEAFAHVRAAIRHAETLAPGTAVNVLFGQPAPMQAMTA